MRKHDAYGIHNPQLSQCGCYSLTDLANGRLVPIYADTDRHQCVEAHLCYQVTIDDEICSLDHLIFASSGELRANAILLLYK